MKPIERALLSLDGLSVGDALGQRFFGSSGEVRQRIDERRLPDRPWRYTDDTEMALSVVDALRAHGEIDSAALVALFAKRHNPERGYGRGARNLLQAIRAGADWQREAQAMFGGQGSFGNGSAMRIAPLGAYFAEDLAAAALNAERSAVTTHANCEGKAGAVAITVAAALAWRVGEGDQLAPAQFLQEVLDRVPPSLTRDGVVEATSIPLDETPERVAAKLGSGQKISSQDTVPFCLWCAARHLESYEEAFWTTVRGLGDRDTTCAIVGGIVALSDRDPGIPGEWLATRESLPV